MIEAFAQTGEVKSAEAWLEQIVQRGHDPDLSIAGSLLPRNRGHRTSTWSDQFASSAFGALIKAYASAGNIKRMEAWAHEMALAGLHSSRELRDKVAEVAAAHGDVFMWQALVALPSPQPRLPRHHQQQPQQFPEQEQEMWQLAVPKNVSLFEQKPQQFPQQEQEMWQSAVPKKISMFEPSADDTVAPSLGAAAPVRLALKSSGFAGCAVDFDLETPVPMFGARHGAWTSLGRLSL